MEYTIRKATANDIDFLTEAIIAAEKSGSDKLGLATFFDISEEKVKSCLKEILEEEIVGCEFSLDSFKVVDHEATPVAAVAGWIEGYDEDNPGSQILKSNLIGFVYPVEAIQAVRERQELIQDLLISRKKGALQIEYVYVSSGHRGQGLARELIAAHIAAALEKTALEVVEVQLFANNAEAIKLYDRMGFEIKGRYIATENEILKYLAHSEKLLMSKKVNV